jgi:uroporphyrinogen decarboxylase
VIHDQRGHEGRRCGSTPRDRFLAAIERTPGHGVSWDLGYGVTGLSRVAHENLCAHLGVPIGEQSFWSVMLQTVYPDPALQQGICGDLRLVSVRAPITVPDFPMNESSLATYRDEWGIVRKLSANGLYYDIVESPLAGCNSAEACLAAMTVPQDPSERSTGLREAAREYREQGYAVGASCFAGIFEMLFWLRGFKNAYLDFARDPRIAEAVMDRLLDVQMSFWGAICDELEGGMLDVALLTEDLGTQRSLMISPEDFRRVVRPRIGELISFIKRRSPGTRVLLHSCGAIFPLIGDLIDIGVDLLNPVQPRAVGMDPVRVKAEYGDDIVFHGGVDIQSVLCDASPAEVTEHVLSLIEVLGEGGGYIVAPAHCVQADVPPENIIAMVDAVGGVAEYPGL